MRLIIDFRNADLTSRGVPVPGQIVCSSDRRGEPSTCYRITAAREVRRRRPAHSHGRFVLLVERSQVPVWAEIDWMFRWYGRRRARS